MALLIENVSSGIILTARSFNPSIFTETWLARNEIIAPDSLEGVRIFSSQVVQFQTKEVQVLVVPTRVQILFSIKEITGEFEVPRKIAVRIVELLPQTPYQSLGLNFDFFVSSSDEKDFSADNRKLLGTGKCQLLQEFSATDARFGRYFSKGYNNARLRLDIKPIKVDSTKKEMLKFSFNFNHDIAEIDFSERVTKVVELIETWGALRDYSARLVEMGTQL